MSGLIQINNLNKSYGMKHVINDMNLELEGGKIVGLLGPNGSGKSTLIKMLGGVLKANSGEILIDGKPVSVETKKIVSYLPERTYLSPSMKVKEAIRMFEDFYEDFKRERAEEMLGKLNISVNDTIKSLSKGTREKVQLVLVMSRDAKVYLLDEPMGGVDPAARDYILKTILTNYNENACVLISTHLISDVEKVLDEVVFIQNGNVILNETVDEIRENKGKSVDALFREVFTCLENY
ncbi:MAG: ABC transporter ATP-binding protein [Lachnospira sp.]|nr:ABC transporter ATP-binding protein [Lachnospira sp.]MDD5828716.1 ABC transporter ATP-binding protein [Lachnospira sp.]